MRFSLRNQSKIETELGNTFIKQLLESLNKHFKENTVIEEIKSNEVNYKTIEVKGITRNKYIMCIVGKTYDVYNLAFYKEIK